VKTWIPDLTSDPAILFSRQYITIWRKTNLPQRNTLTTETL